MMKGEQLMENKSKFDRRKVRTYRKGFPKRPMQHYAFNDASECGR